MVDPRVIDAQTIESSASANPRYVYGFVSHRVLSGTQTVHGLYAGVFSDSILSLLQWFRKLFVLGCLLRRRKRITMAL